MCVCMCVCVYVLCELLRDSRPYAELLGIKLTLLGFCTFSSDNEKIKLLSILFEVLAPVCTGSIHN